MLSIRKAVVAKTRMIGEVLTPSAVMDTLRQRQIEGVLTPSLIKTAYQTAGELGTELSDQMH